MPSPAIDESTLTKGQLRKLISRRKSVGNDIGERAFAEWLAAQAAVPPEDQECGAGCRGPVASGGAGNPETSARRLHRQARPRQDRRRAGRVVNRPPPRSSTDRRIGSDATGASHHDPTGP